MALRSVYRLVHTHESTHQHDSVKPRMHLCEVRGKSTRGLRKVYNLMTPEMVSAIEHLLTVRIFAGVNPENRFIFGRTSTSPLDACTAMRKVTEVCPNLKKPELIRSRLLRKYLATTSQVMDMTSDVLRLVADHMGHSLDIHTNIYKMQSSLLERTKVARTLIAMEKGQLGDLRGQNLDLISLDAMPFERDDEDDEKEEENQEEEMVVVREEEDDKLRQRSQNKRKRWTAVEERELSEAFAPYLKTKKNASSYAIREAMENYPNLQQVIRVKINNIILGKDKSFNM